jgi:hypothetical protein
MEAVKAGKEFVKVVVKCRHCEAEWKMDHRQAEFRCLDIVKATWVPRFRCKNCTFATNLDKEQQEALGITLSMFEDVHLEVHSDLQRMGKKHFLTPRSKA